MARLDIRHFGLHVDKGRHAEERVLVVVNEGGDEHRIPIPVSRTVEALHGTTRSGIAVSAGLLMLALAGSGVLASRLTRPLRRLADSAEALGRGNLGVQVPETAAGEVGELQSAFNRMSRRLAELEEEREMWLRREHLAQLGDLSRGLAHTLRNPLNTLGLAVEELSHDGCDGERLAFTARAQIRRIDRWLRSFLALGAGDALEAEEEDLSGLTQGVVLEGIQEGARIELTAVDDDLPVLVISPAIRAALANLVENAAEASPEGMAVEVTIRQDGPDGVVTIADRGPGLPQEVRQRLYEPHVTTKAGGSGMGLFLARQLVVGMHGGVLDVRQRAGGGTVVEMRLSLVRNEEGDGGEIVD
jgi:signal transduction histidine kinase